MLSATTNTAALTAQRFLGQSSTAASSSIAKMSSGSRIVKASDDASSLAIGNKLRADISALEQASRNASQGASLLQVANGALDRVGDIMTRLKTLSTQVVNGTLSSTERQFAHREFSNLVTQVDEIAAQTRWNDIALFNGSDKSVNEADISTVAGSVDITADTTPLDAANSAGFGDNVANFTGMIDGAVKDVRVENFGAGQYKIEIDIGEQTFEGIVGRTAPNASVLTFQSTTNDHNSFTMALTAAMGSAGLTTANEVEDDLKVAFDLSDAANPAARFQSSVLTSANGAALLNVSATGIADVVSASGSTQDGLYSITSRYDANTEELTLRLNDDKGNMFEQKIDNVNNVNYVDAGTNTQTLRFGNGVELTLTDDKIFDAMTADINGLQFDVDAGAATTLEFQIGVQATDLIEITFDSMTAAGLGLDVLNVETIEGGKQASAATSEAINKINIATAELGALQSRMQYVESNVETIIENLSAAKGSFLDVDMAKEMTEFTKHQTLMQAGVAMLAQANQMPQELLRLIQ